MKKSIFSTSRVTVSFTGRWTPEEVDKCNAAINHYAEKIRARSVDDGGLARGSSTLHGQTGRLELTGMLGWEKPHRETISPTLSSSGACFSPK